MALITPEQLAKSGSEDGTQMAYVQACRTQLQPLFPEVMLMYHVPNGGQRGDAKSAGITMARMKAMGLVAGVPDVCIPVGKLGYTSLYIEFKKPDGKGSLSQEQYDYIKLLTENGNLVVICDKWDHAADVTRLYLAQDMNIKLLLTDQYVNGIPPYRLIDVSGYVDKLVRSKKFIQR